MVKTVEMDGRSRVPDSLDAMAYYLNLKTPKQQCENCGTLSNLGDTCPNCTIDMVRDDEGAYVKAEGG
jgi:hypothetical protein